MPTFDRFAEEYSFWIERVNPPRYQQLMQGFLPAKLETALDAGCGPGFLSLYLADHARTVVGFDLSAAMVGQARRRQLQRHKDNIHYTVADLNNLPFGFQRFDFVTSDCVLHDTDLQITLPGLISLLRPGGRLFIRDLVTHNPTKSTSPTWHVLQTIRRTPGYVRRLGLTETRRLLLFELRPAWVRHKCEGANLTPQRFRALYQTILPTCRFLDYGWTMAVVWEAPT